MSTDRMITCPQCGAEFAINEEDTQGVCPQCGATVSMHAPTEDDGTSSETPATPLPTQPVSTEQTAKKKAKRIQAIMFVIWLIATVLTIGGCLYLLLGVGGKNGLIGFVVFMLAGGLPVVGGGAYVVFKVIPETDMS